MKRHNSVVCLALAAVAVLGLVGPLAAQVQVPFKGALVGVDIGVPIPNTTTSAVTVQATGNATLLGKFLFAAGLEVNNATGMANGTILFTAANGDRIFGTIAGKATFTPPNVLEVVEIATVTGGTGRFTGSTGSILITRVKNTATNVTTATFIGALSPPGAGG